MPLSYATYTGNGSTTTFSVPFPYLLKSHVKLYYGLDVLAGTYTSLLVDGTDYSWSSATQVQLTTAPTASQVLTIVRDTPDGVQLVDFQDGSNLIADDLNTSDLQKLYVTQEQQDRNDLGATTALAAKAAADTATTNVATLTTSQVNKNGSVAMTGNLNLGSNRIVNVTNPTGAQDAATKNYVDTFVNQTANIAAAAVTTAKIADSAVTSAKIADGTIVAGDLASDSVVTAKILDANVTTAKLADSSVTTAKLADANVTTGKLVDSSVTTAKIADANVTTGKVADSAVTTAKINDAAVTTAKINDAAVTGGKIASDTIDSSKLTAATVVTNAEVSGVTVNDTSFFTTSASDLRYFRQDSSETIASGNTWSASDNFIATTAAIDARIVDLVDDVGGFVPIANETSFPATNPDVNDGAGTLISVQSVVTTRTPAAGTVTIANGSGSNTVTITGCGSTVLSSGYGLIVETTSTLHTYTFHRLVPRATEVTTVAGIAADVTTVATNVVDVQNFADLYQIASADPATRADTTPLVEGDLYYNTTSNVIRAYNGTTYQNITPDAATLADISVVADDLATFDDLGLITDALTAAQSGGALETCADNIADIQLLADIEDGTAATSAISDVAAIRTNVTTVAGSITSVNTVAGSIANVNTVAGRDADIGTLADIEDGTNATNAIQTVAGISGNVTTVAGQISPTNNVGTVAGAATNIATVAGQISPTNNISTVAGKATDITTVAGQISPTNNISTVAGAATNVGTVAGSISSVNTVAGSIADVNRYAEEYKISASAPGSPSAGDLWYDSTNNVLKFFNGTTFASISAGITQVSDDTSPELGGALNANGNNISSVGTIDGTNLTIDFGTL